MVVVVVCEDALRGATRLALGLRRPALTTGKTSRLTLASLHLRSLACPLVRINETRAAREKEWRRALWSEDC